MFCCLDDHDHILLAERIDADEKAIEDLARQAKEQPPILAQITKAKIKELKAEKRAADQFGVVYKKATRRLMDSLKDTIDQSSPEALLSLPKDQLIELILAGGIAESVEDFIDQQNKMLEAINESISVVDPTWTPLFIQTEVESIQALTVQNVFDDIVVPSVAKNVKDSLLSMVIDTPPSLAISNLALSLERGAGTLQTEVRTKISQFGRSVNMIAADTVGMDHYLYTGPKDGITRSFCRPLVNKVVDKTQLGKLNNGQGLSVRTSGGGYNCRHSWSPVTESFVKAAGLDKATAADISKANSGGKKKR
tara:strand:+ start:818 stop:1741 length:924 start_codon:yes stop_codon:yes gene_type:complete